MKYKIIFIFTLLALFVYATDATTLDQLQKDLVVHGTPLILSYSISSNSAYVQLNPEIWDSLSSDEQRQIEDKFVATGFVKDMGLINAWFLIGTTNIGHIKPGFSGYSWEPAR